MNINPGIGVGSIKFGSLINDVIEILGQPNRREKYSYTESEEDLTETLYYEDLGIDFGFDEEDERKLGLITIESQSFTLFETISIGIEKEELEAKLSENNITDLIYEDMAYEESPTHELISSDSLGIFFWFDENRLSEMQVSPLFIDDDTIEWPK